MNGLEALKLLMEEYYEMCQDTGNNDDQYQKYNLTSPRAIIEKELKDGAKHKKALDIIVAKEVDVMSFKCCLDVGWDYDLFENNCQDSNSWNEDPPYKHHMTEEEFELVKEELKQ